MARFTRADIRAVIGEGCTEDIENKLIALHLGVVDPLKDDVQRYKADAEKLPDLQRKLEEASKGDDYKEKYDSLVAQITGEKAQAAKEKAARAYFQSKGIPAESMGLVIRGAKAEIDGLELDGEKIKDSKALDDLLAGDYKGLIGKETKTGTNTQTPPATTGGGKMTKEQIMGIKDTAQRQAAMLANAELFGIS